MATNARQYYGDKKTEDLYTRDLAIGDKLIRVITRGGEWNSPIHRTEVEVTVTKVLPSRLVVVDADGCEYRVLVANSKVYTSRNGEVSTDLEGHSTSYRRSPFELYTPDDPKLIADRESTAANNARIAIKQTTQRDVAAVDRSLTIENATAAIEALQAWLAYTEARAAE